MAYVTSQGAAGTGFVAWFGDVVAAWAVARQRRAVYARTVKELSGLTDRELSDINLSRAQIHDVAHQAAFGK